MNLINEINNTDRSNINDVLNAAINRYRQLYPDWEISLISIEKESDRDSEIEKMIELLNNCRKQSEM